MVIEFYEVTPVQLQHELNSSNSPYYSASWFLLRQQEFPLSLKPLHSLRVDVLKVLLWASRFGFHALYVKDQHIERTRFLQSTLIDCTTNLLATIDTETQPKHIMELQNQIATLWSHVFSPLLIVGTKQNGVPHAVTLLLASRQYPPKSDWPLLVKCLCSVLHEKAEKIQTDYLLESDLFRRLNERKSSDQDHTFTLPSGSLGTRFVTGLLYVGPAGSVLSREWQSRLLTTANVVIPDQFCKYVAYVVIIIIIVIITYFVVQKASNNLNKCSSL